MSTNPIPMRRIAAHFVLTPHGLLKGGMITLDPEGRVVGVSAPTEVNSLPNVEFYSGILIPGMVNAHTHLELSYLKGAINAGGGFAGFAAGLRENRGRFSMQDINAAIDYQDARLWSEGLQAVGDICNGDSTFGTKKKSRIAYHSFMELFGLNAGTTEAASTYSLRDKAFDSGLVATVTPHSVYSLNEKGFGLSVGGPENSPLSIHFMESPGEKELFEGHGEIHDWYIRSGFHTDFTSVYQSPVERLVSLVPAERKVLLVHNTLIGQGEIEILKMHFGDNVTFVLCPRSNRFITGLTPPADLLRRNNVRIAVGTDSLASNLTLSMIDELKALGNIPLEESLRWATIGGAQALGMDGELGSFDEGKRPGVVLLTGVEWSDFSLKDDAATRRIV